MPRKEYGRMVANIIKLPKLVKRIKELEDRLNLIEKKSDED